MEERGCARVKVILEELVDSGLVSLYSCCNIAYVWWNGFSHTVWSRTEPTHNWDSYISCQITLTFSDFLFIGCASSNVWIYIDTRSGM